LRDDRQSAGTQDAAYLRKSGDLVGDPSMAEHVQNRDHVERTVRKRKWLADVRTHDVGMRCSRRRPRSGNRRKIHPNDECRSEAVRQAQVPAWTTAQIKPSTIRPQPATAHQHGNHLAAGTMPPVCILPPLEEIVGFWLHPIPPISGNCSTTAKEV